MQKPKQRIYFIDLNGPDARTNLKLLGLAYPAWGIILPIGISDIGQHPFFPQLFNAQNAPLLIFVYLMLVILSLSILTNRLIITGKSIQFGHSPFNRYATSDLKTLTLEKAPPQKEETLLTFKFDHDSRSTKYIIDTQDMEDRMKTRLITALDNAAPNCHVPKTVRSLLTRKARAITDASNSETIVICYRSRLLIQKLTDTAMLYQPLFWRVWTGFFAFVSILFVPPILVQSLNIDETSPGMAIMFTWIQLSKVLNPVIEQTSNASVFIYDFSSQYAIAALLCVIGYLFILFITSYLIRPNRFKITWLGCTESRHYFGIDLVSQSLGWADLIAVSLNKEGKADPQNWSLILHGGAKENDFQVVLGALGGNSKTLEVIRAIEKHAPHVPIDADIHALFIPKSENSFTSLWLSSLAGAPQREKLTPLQSGHSLKDGAYIVESRLGAGGQGVAYLARALSNHSAKSMGLSTLESAAEMEAELVIKETILPVYADSGVRRQALEDFEREAQLLLKLDNNNLAKLLDFFVEDHRAYLVLERARGQNLRKFVEEKGALPPLVVLELTKQMCDMLTYLHAQDPPVIHRDFTPENIIVNNEGHLKLIDFGVAHQLKSRTTATVVGKHAYLPPEQLRGKPTSQSDIYALAATIYFLLTACEPEPLSRLNPFEQIIAQKDLNEEEKKTLNALCQAMEHATELDTNNRTKSASQFLEDLEQKLQSTIKIRTKLKYSAETANG